MCLSCCRTHLCRHFQFTHSLKKRIESHKQYQLMQSPHYLQHHNSAVNVSPIIEFALNLLNEKPVTAASRKQVRELLGSEASSTVDVGTLQWLHYEEVESLLGVQREISTAMVASNLQLCVTALHLVSVALAAQPDKRTAIKAAVFYQAKSLRLSAALWPARTVFSQSRSPPSKSSLRRQSPMRNQHFVKQCRSPSKRPKKAKSVKTQFTAHLLALVQSKYRVPGRSQGTSSGSLLAK